VAVVQFKRCSEGEGMYLEDGMGSFRTDYEEKKDQYTKRYRYPSYTYE
jgi:hypothetical protein